MAPQIAKAIFVGNIKGGVGKSTLSVYLTEYLRRRFKRQSVTLIDTDPQGTSFELMEPKSTKGDTRFLPVGDRYDGVNMSTLDGVLRRLLAQNENMAIVDTGAGKLGNFWQMAFLCNTTVVQCPPGNHRHVAMSFQCCANTQVDSAGMYASSNAPTNNTLGRSSRGNQW